MNDGHPNPPPSQDRPPKIAAAVPNPYASPPAQSVDQEAGLGDSAGLRMIVPVGRSIWAILAGYLGLFSVLLIPAPFAVLFGLLAIREMRRNPKKHGMGRAIFGIVCGSLAMLLTAIVMGMGMLRSLAG